MQHNLGLDQEFSNFFLALHPFIEPRCVAQVKKDVPIVPFFEIKFMKVVV